MHLKSTAVLFYEKREHTGERIDLKELCVVRTTAQGRAERLEGVELLFEVGQVQGSSASSQSKQVLNHTGRWEVTSSTRGRSTFRGTEHRGVTVVPT